MNFYDEDKRPKIERIKIPQYTNKKGKVFDRNIRAQPGMAELINIVAGLQKDVRRINKCLTLDGAKEYVKDRSGWNAFEQDITGPDGHPDGIPEVVVTDAYGNIKVINGYGLRKGTYPQRKMYQYMKHRVYKDRPDEKYTYGEFRNDVHRIQEGFNENGDPYYANVLPEDFPSQFKGRLPRSAVPSAKELFKQHIFTPVYEGHKESIKEAAKQTSGQPGMVCAQINTKAFRVSYKELVLKQVYNSLGRDLDELSQEENEKEKRKFDKTNKTAIEMTSMQIVKDILSDQTQLDQTQQDINSIIADVANELLAEAQLKQEQLDEFKNRSQSIALPQSRVFNKAPVTHSTWGYIPSANQSEMTVAELE